MKQSLRRSLRACLITVLLALAVVVGPAIAQPLCDDFATNPTNGHQYCLTTPGTWTASQAEAVAKGGNLVTINDRAEQDWLLETFGNTPPLWIGYTDAAAEGSFVWAGGQNATYTNWLATEPNDGKCYANEDYAASNWFNPAGSWNDLPNEGFWQDCTGVSAFCGLEGTPQAVPPACETGFVPLAGIVEIESKDEAAEKESYCSDEPIQFIVRSGDVDGFGYGNGAGLVAANGGPANAKNSVVLSTGNFLPSLNKNKTLAAKSGDDFDNRSAAEVAGTVVTGTGFTDKGTQGSEYTDISLSTSYGSKVFQASSGTYGAGGPFPGDGNPKTRSNNQPGFEFHFETSKAVLPKGTPLFFNLVFGDYDVKPAKVQFVDVNGKSFTKPVTAQPTKADGAIQAAFLELDFDRVFKEKDADTWIGALKVNFVAPKEPYTAFDYAEIGTQKIAIGGCS